MHHEYLKSIDVATYDDLKFVYNAWILEIPDPLQRFISLCECLHSLEIQTAQFALEKLGADVKVDVAMARMSKEDNPLPEQRLAKAQVETGQAVLHKPTHQKNLDTWNSLNRYHFDDSTKRNGKTMLKITFNGNPDMKAIDEAKKEGFFDKNNSVTQASHGELTHIGSIPQDSMVSFNMKYGFFPTAGNDEMKEYIKISHKDDEFRATRTNDAPYSVRVGYTQRGV